jgi:hypothetical protein
MAVKAEVTTDKELYKPGETVKIELFSSEPLNNVELSIIKPNGNLETSKTSMKNISLNHWGYNHTLKTSALNGTYIIKIKAFQGGTLINASTPIIEFNKTFDVLAWKANAYLNKHFFAPGNTLNLTFLITDKYSDKLTFDVFYSLKDPLENEVVNYSLTLTEANKGFLEIYDIPENYTFGTSNITIKITDSDKRTAMLNLSFYVGEVLSLSPKYINETSTGEVSERIIILENLGDSDINIERIEISKNLENIVSIKQRPYLILPKDKATMKIEIDTTNLGEGSYNGVINVYSNETKIPVYINLEVSSPVIEQRELPENYSYIIWYFAIGVVVVIVLITILRYRKSRKKKEEEKKKKEEKKPKEEAYYKQQEEYRTEYY